ncbi:hypothetical protein [Pseudomonas sp. TMP9]|uniref:hypothetical protein n=1 Tax=Pseudomonas sp. TMP9 TaxID=3133144 RepID=UPI0030D00487
MSELKPVTFAKVWRGYNVAETAGFPADVADMLVSNGTAVEYDPAAVPGAKPKKVRAAAPKSAAKPGPAAVTDAGGAPASGGADGNTDIDEAKP